MFHAPACTYKLVRTCTHVGISAPKIDLHFTTPSTPFFATSSFRLFSLCFSWLLSIVMEDFLFFCTAFNYAPEDREVPITIPTGNFQSFSFVEVRFVS